MALKSRKLSFLFWSLKSKHAFLKGNRRKTFFTETPNPNTFDEPLLNNLFRECKPLQKTSLNSTFVLSKKKKNYVHQKYA